MTIKRYIVFLVGMVYAVWSTPGHAITTEQEQQFKYYWYAAKQAITEERFADAYVLLEFCRAINPDDGTTAGFLGVIQNGVENIFAAWHLFATAFEVDPYDQWYRYYKFLSSYPNLPDKNRKILFILEQAHEVQSQAVKNGKAKVVDEQLLEELIMAYITDSQWKKALEIQDEMDLQKGYDAYSAVTRYRIYVMWGKPKKALEAIDKYLEQDPTNLQFLMFRLEVMEQMGAKPKELYAMYDRILEQDPFNLMVLNNYAYHLATHKGDLQKAEKMSAITIHEDPQNPVYLDTYGWILHLQGQDNLAQFYLNRALQNAYEETKAEIETHIKALKK